MPWAQQWDLGLQVSCSVDGTRVETREVETAALVQAQSVEIVVGRREPYLAPASGRDRRDDGFDESAPNT